MAHHQILIIGGGTGGIMTAAQLKRKNSKLDVAIIEPSEKHYYQPAWTLVGAGTYDYQDTIREEKRYIPKGVKWIKDWVTALDPKKNALDTADGGQITYDYLVVSPGVVNNLDAIEGLKDTLGQNNVCSVYTDPNYVWDVLKNTKKGQAVFTQPAGAFKCGGAPQKIMYLSEHHFRKKGVRDDVNVIFATPGTVIFGVEEFKETLDKIIEERNIFFKPYHKPVAVDGPNKTATFEITDMEKATIEINDDLGEKIIEGNHLTIPFDMFHTAPPQQAPDFLRNSELVHSEGPMKGFGEVDINTLQHKTYANVFIIGDSAALPTAKTGAAIRKQAPVVVENILELIAHQKISDAQYEGYSSCPLVTGYGSMVLAEFKYGNVRDSDPIISTFVDTTKERYSMWLLKKYGLPYLYWNHMLRGRL
jgi:sulfide:quinone oxidoreductase